MSINLHEDAEHESYSKSKLISNCLYAMYFDEYASVQTNKYTKCNCIIQVASNDSVFFLICLYLHHHLN